MQVLGLKMHFKCPFISQVRVEKETVKSYTSLEGFDSSIMHDIHERCIINSVYPDNNAVSATQYCLVTLFVTAPIRFPF